MVGDDVVAGAAVDGGDGEDGGNEGVTVFGEEGLIVLDEVGGGEDGVAAAVGHGGVCAFSLDGDDEVVGRGKEGTRAYADVADGEVGVDVLAEDGTGNGWFEEFREEESGTSGTAFFAGLEDEFYGAGEGRFTGFEEEGGGEEDGEMYVMATSVHESRVEGGEWKTGFFVDFEGIHVSTSGDAGVVACADAGDEACADGGVGDVVAVEDGGDVVLGLGFLHGEFGVGV